MMSIASFVAKDCPNLGLPCFHAWLLMGALFVASPGLDASEPVDFNHDIRPILSRHCIACHGPDEEDRQADLRLDTFEGATEYAIEPGNPDESDVIDRILSDDEDLRMPPADHADPLSPQEVELLRRWIESGAEYQKHWSFTRLSRPEVPEIAAGPSLASETAPFQPIDAFIHKQVLAAGLAPNAPADPQVLVRRLSLDLTGLPPISHPSEVQQAFADYLASPSQPKLARVVDSLLDTEAYAEHWCSMWLDIARYADSVGYAGDERRDIWPWRDWLIRTIAANKSYKDMSIEMLAGDLLPSATDDQQLASAFHRNTLSNNEGGTSDEEFRMIAVKDRLSTTMNAWMGLTVRCAECHSHKYDPISQHEYYQLLDFFNHTADADRRDENPRMPVPMVTNPDLLADWDRQLAELREKLVGRPQVWTIRRPVNAVGLHGTELELLDDGSLLATGENPRGAEYELTFEIAAGQTLRAIRLEALPHEQYDLKSGRSPKGSFILSQLRMVAREGDTETLLEFSDAEADYHSSNRHPRTLIRKKINGKDSKQGWTVLHPVQGGEGHHEAIFELKQPWTPQQDAQFTISLLHASKWPGFNMACFRIATCDVAGAVAKYKNKKLDPINRRIRQLTKRRNQTIRVPISKELPPSQRRETFVHLRGNYLSPGDQVRAAFPAAFASSTDWQHDRLGLAKWLFADDNPLTARVAVNRYWSRIMGIGLVETEEDFGTQGTPPSHPELLDYLAADFKEGGWDVKRLLRQIVLSQTYQQSPVASQESLDKDPRNRLLSRGPRVRLSAEVVRDQALAVAGLLSDKVYGPPVYPPSPIKRVVNAFTGGMVWVESKGEDRYRRALYTFLKRSAPHPLFETFDMASRDVCSMRRLRTNTPLQSFMTLNDITFIEAARSLGDSMLEGIEYNETRLAEAIDTGLRRALYVDGDQRQREVLVKLYQTAKARYASDREAAAEFMGAPSPADGDGNSELSTPDQQRLVQRAAMAVVCNVILNLDGFLNN